MRQRRRQFLHLFVAEILPRDRAAKYHARIQRVRRDVTIFAARVHRPPIMKIQRKVTAAAWSGNRVTVLLRAINPIRKLVVRNHVIELRRWLVEPAAPRLTGLSRPNRSPVPTEDHPSDTVATSRQLGMSA